MSHKYLIIVDMQNDFISGELGSTRAEAIVPNIIKKIKEYDGNHIYLTRDIHSENYLDTLEGKKLPIKHCIENTDGVKIERRIWKEALKHKNIHFIFKHTFGSLWLAKVLKKFVKAGDEIEIVGVCTDICVVSNALLLRAALPDIEITVNSSCCAGTTKEKHDAALETMKSCQINVI